VASRTAGSAETFSRDELRAFFARNIEKLAGAAVEISKNDAGLSRHLSQAQTSLAELAALLESPAQLDLEDLERHLTVIEDKLTAALTAGAREDTLLLIRRELDRQLAPYRRRMTVQQLGQLERQYTQKRLFEKFDLPRLSLFYLT